MSMRWSAVFVKNGATILASNTANQAITPLSLSSSLILHQQLRTRVWTNVRPILGWPRKTLAKMNRKYPEAHLYNWRPYLPADGQYTTSPLPILKMGGRDLENGRVVVRTVGGGNIKRFRWIDMFRKANEDGSVKEEQVLLIRYDPLHTPKIALVAGADTTRWIFATDGIKPDDIIRTHSEIPRNPIIPKNGDAHPIGALPVGTKIHCIEIMPGRGAKFCLVAGSCAEIVNRSIPSSVTVKLPNNDTYKIDPSCMATVGRLSNVGHQDIQLWCPQRNRWLGNRPRSGQWHRKDGYCGRKFHRPKNIDVTTERLERIRKEQIEKELYDLSL